MHEYKSDRINSHDKVCFLTDEQSELSRVENNWTINQALLTLVNPLWHTNTWVIIMNSVIHYQQSIDQWLVIIITHGLLLITHDSRVTMT